MCLTWLWINFRLVIINSPPCTVYRGRKGEAHIVSDTVSSHYHSLTCGSGMIRCMVFCLLGLPHITAPAYFIATVLYNNCVNYPNIILKCAVESQAAAGTQVDASVLGLSTLTQAVLGTGRLLCHKTGRQPAMLERVGLQKVLWVAVWTQKASQRQATYWSPPRCGNAGTKVVFSFLSHQLGPVRDMPLRHQGINPTLYGCEFFMCYFIDVDNYFRHEVLDFTPALMSILVYEIHSKIKQNMFIWHKIVFGLLTWRGIHLVTY